LTKISDLIGRLLCDLVRFFDNLIVVYFLDHYVYTVWPKSKPLSSIIIMGRFHRLGLS